MSSELTPGEVRAAAEVHRDLGPEYSDAVVESFLERIDRRVAERIDREVAARVDARLREPQPHPHPQPRPQPQPQMAQQIAPSHGRLLLLTGVSIGVVATAIPSIMVASSVGGVAVKDETTALVFIAAIWVVVTMIVALRAVPRQVRNRGRSA